MDFLTFLSKTNPERIMPVVIALDPGETTGYAVFVEGTLERCGELDTETLKVGYPALMDLFASVRTRTVHTPQIVYEEYRIYSWKTEQHTWAGLHTPQLIGGIEALAYVKHWPTYGQTAQVAKGFCTDDKLKMWGMYQKGQRHARDAIRHGAYYLLFNNRQDKLPPDHPYKKKT